MNRDITYCCGVDCERKERERHPERLKGLPVSTMVSIADFRGICRKYIFDICEHLDGGIRDGE